MKVQENLGEFFLIGGRGGGSNMYNDVQIKGEGKLCLNL